MLNSTSYKLKNLSLLKDLNERSLDKLVSLTENHSGDNRSYLLINSHEHLQKILSEANGTSLVEVNSDETIEYPVLLFFNYHTNVFKTSLARWEREHGLLTHKKTNTNLELKSIIRFPNKERAEVIGLYTTKDSENIGTPVGTITHNIDWLIEKLNINIKDTYLGTLKYLLSSKEASLYFIPLNQFSIMHKKPPPLVKTIFI